jgi:hypothetical protein
MTPVPGSQPNSDFYWALSGAGCSGSTCGTLTVTTTQAAGANPISGTANYIAPSSLPQPNTVVPALQIFPADPPSPVRALISTHQSGQHRHPLEHGAGQQPAHHHDAGSDARRPFAWDRANYSAVPQRVHWRASHDPARCTFGSIQGTLFPQSYFPARIATGCDRSFGRACRCCRCQWIVDRWQYGWLELHRAGACAVYGNYEIDRLAAVIKSRPSRYAAPLRPRR